MEQKRFTQLTDEQLIKVIGGRKRKRRSSKESIGDHVMDAITSFWNGFNSGFVELFK